MSDRYTKIVLTIIAVALCYLCVVLTPFTTVSAQTALRPGDPTGPGQVVIVGWHTSDVAPVAFQQPVRITATEPLRITGSVATERSTGAADRVVVVGWEENATRDHQSPSMRPFDSQQGLPVRQR
jgi:hypothetical protein